MTWMELRWQVKPEAVDWVCTLLREIQYADSLQVTRDGEPEICSQDISPIANAETFTICLYLPYDINVRERVERIDQLLSSLRRVGLATELETVVVETVAQPNVTNELSQRIGQRFVVLAPDMPYHFAPEEIEIRLGTNFAFGRGSHPATIVALQLIERHLLPQMQVLDLGSGSGILSVAMAKLGATVLALDNDRLAVQATQSAIEQNGVAQQVTVMPGSLGRGGDLGHWMGGEGAERLPGILPQASFDLIVSNILARVHIALAPELYQALSRRNAHPGILITSGFTIDQEQDVDQALTAAGFVAIDCERRNEWVALAHRLN